MGVGLVFHLCAPTSSRTLDAAAGGARTVVLSWTSTALRTWVRTLVLARVDACQPLAYNGVCEPLAVSN